MNDELTNDKPRKVSPPLYWIGTVCLFALTAYNLFEAYRVEEVWSWRRSGPWWVSYQSSPNEFVFSLTIHAIGFLYTGFLIVTSLYRKITGK